MSVFVITTTTAYVVTVDYDKASVECKVHRTLDGAEAYALGLSLRNASLSLNNAKLELGRYEARQAKERERRRRQSALMGDSLIEEDNEDVTE